MSELNKSYRVRTGIGGEYTDGVVNFDETLVQEYDTFEILSVNIKSSDAYRLHNSSHGIIVGRVLANNGFGVPNAKVSIFIQAKYNENEDINILYPYSSSVSKDRDGVRYNLLPNEKVNGCHQVVGTFPSKRYALDNDVVLEVYDTYYKYTTKTNNAGDYMICGVPVGAHTLHMDLDLSDCGILSQKPRDFVYKGYTIEQFENPTKFKSGTDYGDLSQIFSQDQVVNVRPFWGNETLGEEIGITRADINVNFKFEPTCVFMGSITSDNSSNGFSKKCIPTDNMGAMDELVTGEGKIEMIRKTPGGNIEEFQIKGNKLIDGNGVWCYQIPMNLDYMITDEYGNMVPTDNPEKGIPTRASVRFRISMEDHEENKENFFRAKVLVPHNPQLLPNNKIEDYDYEFGTYTRDDSFRDLFWNNVYSVKSYIPRIQKNKNPKKENFSGIKHCQNFGSNNPMPYNNIRIRMPLMFTIMCALIKAFIFIVSIINTVTVWIFRILGWVVDNIFYPVQLFDNGIGAKFNGLIGKIAKTMCNLRLIVLKDGLCPDLENWYFAPCNNKEDTSYVFTGYTSHEEIRKGFAEAYLPYQGGSKCGIKLRKCNSSCNCGTIADDYNSIVYGGTRLCWEVNIMKRTLCSIEDEDFEQEDTASIDSTNKEEEDESICITRKTDYLIACIEMNLAQEYKVINFDFYNDWINGTIYTPRWVRYVKPKTRFLWINWSKEKVKGCMDDKKIYSTSRRYTQQCAIGYREKNIGGYMIMSDVENPIPFIGVKKSNNFHKRRGLKQAEVFGENGGVCHESTTMLGQHVYYLKPCEFVKNGSKKVNLFATDIILLGSFNDCDLNGIPKTFTHLTSSSYVMPTNLALTNMDTQGPLYAKGDGTICMGGSDTNSIEENNIQQIDGSGLTLEAEVRYYENDANQNLNELTDFPFGINLDTMALTEAAGISWNYTGPGQGSIDKEHMYYPGGHFLGISCVNSQTNLKSCINLSRICELGANMSQRRDDVRTNENGILKYTYTAPSGFISGDDIVDSDFRAMFATMNKKRLIATKRNPDTGYKFYDFEFSMPINFNGEFSNLAKPKTAPYNQRIQVTEEDLQGYGIGLGSSRSDYDSEESANTQIRTRETTSIDYYTFRYGLVYDQLSTYDIHLQERKFLRWPQGGDYGYYLPQYENSYYFYFGLKYGATALDEFNKQFYSECDNMMLKKEPNMILTKEVDFCNAGGKIHVMTEGLEIPYESITIYDDMHDEPIYVIDGSIEAHRNCLTSELFVLINDDNGNEIFEFGTYTVTIIDSNGVRITKSITLGLDIVSYTSYVVDFNKPIQNPIPTIDTEGFMGGYVCVYNFSIDGYELSDFSRLKLKIYEDEDLTTEVYSSNINEDETILFGRKKETEYFLVLEYRCTGNTKTNRIKLERFKLFDNSSVRLKLGSQSYSIDCIYGNDSIMRLMTQSSNPDGYWWDEEGYNVGGNDNASSPYSKWFYKAMFFNRNKKKKQFNSNVFAVGGRKVIWGTPQNIRGISSVTGCSETLLGIPPGYSLNDETTYYSTYGVNDCDIVPLVIGEEAQEEEVLRSGINGNPFYPNCIMHFCAQAYNGNKACGNYRGTYKSDTGLNFFDQSYFRNGYGCIFKPLPFGRLVFMTYDSTNNYGNMLSQLSGYDKGVFYPTFIYPVIKRPFFIESEFYKWRDVDIIYNANNAIIKNFDVGYKVYADLNNGVTFNRHFSNESRITGFDEDFFNTFAVKRYDNYGLTETGSTNRVEGCEAFSRTEIEDYNIMYKIVEGYPTNAPSDFSEFTKTHELNVMPEFYTDIAYTVREDSENGNTYINSYMGIGTTDETAQYYFLKIGKGSEASNVNFIHDTNEYIYISRPNNVYYALCKFMKNPNSLGSNYENIVNDSLNDSLVVVKFIVKLSHGDRFVNISYDYVDLDGNNQHYSEDLRAQDDNTSTFDFEHMLKILHYPYYNPDGNSGSMSNPYYLYKGYNQPLYAVKRSTIEENPTISNIGHTWEETILYLIRHYRLTNSQLANNNILIPAKDRPGRPPFVSNEKIFGIGTLAFVDEEGNSTRLFKIYKDPIKVDNDFVPWEGDGKGNVWLSETEKTITAAHTEFSIQVSASSPTTLTMRSGNGPIWVKSITSNGGYKTDDGDIIFDIYRPDVYTVNFVIIHNNDSSNSRSKSYSFESSQYASLHNGNAVAKTFALNQTKALNPANARRKLKLWLTNEHLGNDNYQFSVNASLENFAATEWVEFDFNLNGWYQEDWNFPEDYFNDFNHSNMIMPGWNGYGFGYHAYYLVSPNFEDNGTIIDSNSDYRIYIDMSYGSEHSVGGNVNSDSSTSNVINNNNNSNKNN